LLAPLLQGRAVVEFLAALEGAANVYLGDSVKAVCRGKRRADAQWGRSKRPGHEIGVFTEVPRSMAFLLQETAVAFSHNTTEKWLVILPSKLRSNLQQRYLAV
jgi:hypothetical protein